MGAELLCSRMAGCLLVTAERDCAVTAFELGCLSLPFMLILILLRVPVILAMVGVGVAGQYLILGSWTPFLAQLKHITYSTFSSYSLSVIPMFLLMGQFATKGGLSRSLFAAANQLIGHRRGGIGLSAIGGLWRIWRDLRLVSCDGSDHGTGGIA